MKKLWLSLLLLLPMVAIPKQHDLNTIKPIVKAIKKLNPKVTNENATMIATAIEYCSVDKNIDWKVLVSLAYVESHFDIKVVRKHEGRSVDFGIFQINILNIKRYKLDKNKLKHPVYNTLAACKVIVDIRKKRANWIGYYNVGAGSIDVEKRRNYSVKVAKILAELL